MNKKLIIVGVIIVLVGAAFFFFKQKGSSNSINESVIAPTGTNQAVTNTPTGGTTSKAELDSELNKELDQLDKDIQDGSKDSVNDSDFNF